VKYLVINADDFGYSKGVNKGIIKAYKEGVVTSTSVMVDRQAAKEAKTLLKYQNLSVGLHFNMTDEGIRAQIIKNVLVNFADTNKIRKDFNRQIETFKKITGKLPDHLDGHHHVHTNKKVKPIFEEFSRKHKIPVRAFGNIKFIDKFFGWNKLQQKDHKRIGVESFINILSKLKDGVNEVMCHPGFPDEELKKTGSRYLIEREIEAKTLTDEKVKDYIKKAGFNLVSWKEISYEILNI